MLATVADSTDFQSGWPSQVLYGRPSTPLMYLLTLLQLRVPVEGLIAWRNTRTLKTRTLDSSRCRGCCGKTVLVRKDDFARARVDLDRALLREGIFEALPQAVLEFQNLWADEWAVLDLMSVPGLPLLTSVSEYQLNYTIMVFTIFTATLDLTTPYSTDSLIVGVSLYASTFLQLTARLLVFGSVLSMEKEGQRTTAGMCTITGFFVFTFFSTLGFYLWCNKMLLYHSGDQVYRNRVEGLSTYDITVSTSHTIGAGTSARVWVRLVGSQGTSEEPLYLSTDLQGDDTGSGGSGDGATLLGGKVAAPCVRRDFQAGAERSFTVQCTELGELRRLELGHDGSGTQPRWLCESVVVTAKQRARCWKFAIDEWIGDDDDASALAPPRPASLELAAPEGENTGEDLGMAVFNMQHASTREKALLFAFINSFSCTDKNLSTPPTSQG